ncbi:MAG: deoxyguanosinetriphosphate triphosphohydrolase [Eubacteriales bacterium]|nr:deoxyguanosinetriphosphate triphosphohydrolase [Eubacteriales bacterium]
MASLREEREALEHIMIGSYGVTADASKGRLVPEEEDEIRTCFQRDVDRITHSKAFRRLKHKTQVFLQPEGDHYRTRLTHTLEVSRLARTVARALRLNEDLVEAAALGHDLGHTPFGHAGERALAKLVPGGFRHYEQSLRVVDYLERNGHGLNLSYETRMGILNHTYGSPEDTREATIVRMCDRIAYINHDLDDSVRAGIITSSDIPERIREECGETNSQRINTFIKDIIENSKEGEIAFSPAIKDTYDFFHSYMYSDIYVNPKAKSEERKVDGIIEKLYSVYVSDPGKLPEEYAAVALLEGEERAACDYISGMTDSYAMEKYSELFIPFAWTVK